MDFSLFGMAITVHWTTIFLFAIFAFDSYVYLRHNLKGKSTKSYAIAAGFCTLLVVFSVSLHEVGHAVSASLLGFSMNSAGIHGLGAYVSNGISLNTIEPYKEIIIALAGPATNFLLALIGLPLIYLLGRTIPEVSIRYFSILNFRLGRMNLWPILILDGAKVVEGVIRVFTSNTLVISILLSIVTVGFLFYLFYRKKGRKELESIVDRIP